MNKKLLCVFAHPDDEAFGPGGTIAKYAREGVEIHVLCATKGEGGRWEESSKLKAQSSKLDDVRSQELLDSAKVLGIKRVEFLGYRDGTLCNANYHEIAAKVQKKMEEFEPQVVMTFDRLGVSGHIDHMAMAMMTTYAYKKYGKSQKLYYYCLKKPIDADERNYFIYFPEGYDESVITTVIDTKEMWDIRVKAMGEHRSQKDDADWIIEHYGKKPREEYFILAEESKMKITQKENDLFSGI